MTDPRHDIGLRAEDAVARWLETAYGWRVMARRWRTVHGELDIVCLDGAGILVGVEVRARRSPRAGTAEESVDAARVRRLRRTLAAYASADGAPYRGLRIDLVAVAPSPGHPARWLARRLPGVDAW